MRKLVTLKDIAERAGTSINTVSKALRDHPQVSEKKKKEILQLVEEMHYIPNIAAKNLRRRKTNFIGLIVSDNTNPYFAHIINVVQKKLKEQKYYTLIFNNNENVEDELGIIREMCGLNVEGVLLTPALGNEKSAALLRKYNIPYVLMNRYIEKGKDNYVVADDEKAGYLATRHMLARKPRQTMFINYFDSVSTAVDRQRGYERALKEYGITPDPKWVSSGCMGKEEGFEAMSKMLLTEKAPFSVLCYNDYIALGALSALYGYQYKIPEEVAVMGIDNAECYFIGSYGLSTVNIPIQEIAERSVELLMSMIEAQGQKKKIKPVQITVDPGIVVRQTT
ncbi:MAG: LacI family DNA-binding transcriptional regulator [Christensenella sp.]|uniref:LacI family DNA-binding transcriptional regulator n=1 Tax=Christensenella sp. TaxID=1935934 RepID=UPI002B1FC1DB|nr:LacI family DNA-binding transcriptional regulator [Christensenella sp.]MEA5004175.1 LacI family DNA-binding transcriptional regulator [Christensenella sp.]